VPNAAQTQTERHVRLLCFTLPKQRKTEQDLTSHSRCFAP
jgi:hypothetical protein